MTNFVACVGCGHQLHYTAPTCPKCGAPQAVASVSAGASRTEQQQSTPGTASVDVSEGWKEKFALIEKAGGPGMPNKASLTRDEKWAIKANWLGFFLCALYYFYLGMWKKAITYTVLGLLLTFALAILFEVVLEWPGGSKYLFLIVPALFMERTNRDYYKKVMQNDNGWL